MPHTTITTKAAPETRQDGTKRKHDHDKEKAERAGGSGPRPATRLSRLLRRLREKWREYRTGWKRGREKRVYLRPVAWLLGRQMISSLKGALLFMAYGGKLDARDWMRAEEFPFANTDAARKFLAGVSRADGSPADWVASVESPAGVQRIIEEAAAAWWRQHAESTAGEGPKPRDGEFWFDYISDTGDGVKATYSIAYLCTSDLWVEGSLGELQRKPFGSSRGGPVVGFIARADAPAEPSDEYDNADLNRAPDALDPAAQTELPRGQFLLVGGDATYHLSDYESLHTRFQTPFTWAHADVKRDGRLLKTGRRPLFGIPGNHDYYDQLDGFRRQFHRPVREDEGLREGTERNLRSPQLMIPGFFRRQAATYVSLRLPFGWLLWGLDTEVGKIDERQRKFFRSIKVKDNRGADDKGEGEKAGPRPDRLIVATSAPTTVFGKYADSGDEKSAKAFYQLGLPRPFIDPDEEAEDRDNTLGDDQCRLDLSGDVHQYARYWGRASGHNPREDDGRGPREKKNYASVVSGLGGAFHHPTTTYAGEVCEQVLYPPPEESREEIAKRIFNPLRILRGGGVGIIGFLLAFLVYFAATFSTSSSQTVNNIDLLNELGITHGPTPVVPTTVLDAGRGGERAIYFGPGRNAEPPADYTWGCRLAALSFLSLAASFAPFLYIFRKYRVQEEVSWEDAQPEDDAGQGKGGDSQRAELHSWRAWLAGLPAIALNNFRGTHRHDRLWYEKLRWQFNLYALPPLAVSAASLLGAFVLLRPFRANLTPFGNSMLVLLGLLWSGSAIFLGVRYSDWLTRMASKVAIRYRDWVLVWLISLVAAFAVGFGFAVFGRYNSAGGMATDILLTLVVAAVLVGLPALGAFKFGAVKRGWKRVPFAVAGLILGLFHAVLQLLVPFLLVRRGSERAWWWALALLVVMQLAGWRLMRSRASRLLFLAWLFFGATVLALPHLDLWAEGMTWPQLTAELGKTDGASYDLVGNFIGDGPEQQGDRTALGGVAVCVIAGLVGALSSCVWLGWYFATALTWHGHNNEAAGAAQIERFKQFIRFRLTADDLTGFVVAVDDPKKDGNRLRPRLVDVIYLTAGRR